ncbi:cytochrome c biogenesis protein CcdA [Klugiella xanthotipulae]|uniref:Cytochrome c-type biogenesis protein n=1 Tax=Klugiella xanthotipulae TaxID=244735 RepID=A0A543HZI2_9MICO|nr:cytochrome c biogenesis protein CcdA [Klugiella xanthotipulae]TQM63645.1 cytochrome c-type biogenesis protein [Klugiella xanthotipulae]
MDIQELVYSGQLWAVAPIAMLAGLLSFASPCVLPLVPGYLAYVGGFGTVAEGDEDPRAARRARGRLLLGVAFFVLGFTVVFVMIMVLAGTVGSFLVEWENLITRVMGVIVIIMGLVFVGQFSWMQRTMKSTWQPRTGLIGAPLLGAVFAIGWTPCMGPTLTVIMGLSVQSGSAARAGILGIFYCLGLGIPFLLVALGFGWVSTSTTFLRRHIRAINIVGGAFLVVIGLLMVTGIWSQIMFALAAVMGSYDAPL